MKAFAVFVLLLSASALDAYVVSRDKDASISIGTLPGEIENEISIGNLPVEVPNEGIVIGNLPTPIEIPQYDPCAIPEIEVGPLPLPIEPPVIEVVPEPLPLPIEPPVIEVVPEPLPLPIEPEVTPVEPLPLPIEPPVIEVVPEPLPLPIEPPVIEVLPEPLPLPIEPDVPIPETLPNFGDDDLDMESDVEFLEDPGMIVLPNPELPNLPQVLPVPIPETLPNFDDEVDPNSDAIFLPDSGDVQVEGNEDGTLLFPEHPQIQILPIRVRRDIDTQPISAEEGVGDEEYLPEPDTPVEIDDDTITFD